jgi:hypothetical protein
MQIHEDRSTLNNAQMHRLIKPTTKRVKREIREMLKRGF